MAQQNYYPASVLSKSRPFQGISEFSLRWKKFLGLFATSNKLKTEVLKTKFGITYWVAHDPRTGRKLYFHSEAELSAWCDRHYSPNRNGQNT
ncbi:MAG TPA: hypothetical protein V6C65_21745 [Allocoleopsis sp.]